MTHEEFLRLVRGLPLPKPVRPVRVDVTEWLPFVQWAVNRLAPRTALERDEMVSEAYLILIKAARAWDPDRAGGASFRTYVATALNHAGDTVRRRDSQFRRPRRGDRQVKLHVFSECGRAFTAGSAAAFAVESPAFGRVDDWDEAVTTVAKAFRRIRTPNRRRAVELYYGLGGNPPGTLRSVALIMGVTDERVRQILNNALCDMRRAIGVEIE